MRIRDEQRIGTHFRCDAHIPSTVTEVVILDISTTGCRLSEENRIAQVGATIVLHLGDLREASGQIAWRKDDECGVRFHKPINTDLIDWIAAQS